MLMCSSSFHFTSLFSSYRQYMMCCCLATQHGSMLLSLCHSHVLALTTGGESPEDWRQVEALFDRIRNCGESGGHTESDAYIACRHSIRWPTRSVVN